MKADQDFLNKMLCSSCLRASMCMRLPCACAQSIMDIVVTRTIDRLQDHYWDSLEPHKELIMLHVRGAMVAK